MKHIDEIISALYLAKSDSRKKMLSDLILNVMYNLEGKISFDIINIYISKTFHLEPIQYEIKECLDELIEDKKISISNNHYKLLDISKEYIHKAQLSQKSINEKRITSFKKIISEISSIELEQNDLNDLWNIFNEYLLECFMVFGKKAINIFLPYKNINLNGDSEIIDKFTKRIKNDELILIFKKLTLEYSNHLNEAELRYLTSLASRAEKFYSLGILEEEYEKIKNLKINDLVVLLDTNILYSILSLRKHPEDSAIYEIIRLAKEKQIDLRLVYLPKTYKELQKARKYLEKVIPRENYKISQMNSLIHSGKLDSFAKKYYENKLLNSEIPHPSQKVRYASDILKNDSIILYNTKFKELEENKELFNSLVVEYMDFEHYYNSILDEKGETLHRLQKNDDKIEHDVYLREGIRILKSKYSDENEMKFVCLTLDRSLINFDQYLLRNDNTIKEKVINPNLILPSIFIKKIRPFIPINTNDYRKAFITSLTVPDYEKEDIEESLIVQKSMSYFKNLGIDDEEIILNCIKRELFLEDFVKHEKDNTVDAFIKSEIAIEVERVRKEKESIIYKMNELDNKSKKKIEQIHSEKETIIKKKESDIQKLSDKNRLKDEEIHSLNERLEKIESIQNQINADNIKLKNEKEYNNKLKDWESNREDYIENKWKKQKELLNKSSKYSIRVFSITIISVIIAILLKSIKSILITIESFGINEWYIWGILGLLITFEILGRAYIFNKPKIKEGWDWLISFFNKNKRTEIITKHKKTFDTEFSITNPKPILINNKAPNNVQNQ